MQRNTSLSLWSLNLTWIFMNGFHTSQETHGRQYKYETLRCFFIRMPWPSAETAVCGSGDRLYREHVASVMREGGTRDGTCLTAPAKSTVEFPAKTDRNVQSAWPGVLGTDGHAPASVPARDPRICLTEEPPESTHLIINRYRLQKGRSFQ
jgi:hypothetical protein